MTPIGRHCLVRGRVQGVFFRVATRDQARELGVSGSVRNLSDGSVEVYAYGPESAVGSLCEWLTRGPREALVEDLRITEIPVEAHEGFFIAG